MYILSEARGHCVTSINQHHGRTQNHRKPAPLKGPLGVNHPIALHCQRNDHSQTQSNAMHGRVAKQHCWQRHLSHGSTASMSSPLSGRTFIMLYPVMTEHCTLQSMQGATACGVCPSYFCIYANLCQARPSGSHSVVQCISIALSRAQHISVQPAWSQCVPNCKPMAHS